MSLTIAIIGRPNVGKSTLFNRLVGRKIAIVDNTPGVTRDRRVGNATLGDLEFKIIDTAGLEEAENETLESKMMEQTQLAMQESDLALMMIDVRAGVTPVDEYFTKWARKQTTPVVLLVNKCENKNAPELAAESYKLGLGDPILISAEHNLGMGELYDAIAKHTDDETLEVESVEYESGEEGFDDEPVPEDETLSIAIIGRPNVGKSTFLNQLLGEERSITGPVAGITRDAIAAEMEYDGQKLKIVDTAGMRKKSRVIEKIEKLSVGETIHAIEFAHVVVLLLDGTLGIDKQDLTLADLVAKEGRGLIIAVNKWDIVKGKEKTLEEIRERIEKSLPQIKGVPIITMSALKGKNVEDILDAAFDRYVVWNSRASTAQLNQWLKGIIEKHSPPLQGGRRLKIRYMTQVGTRPPRFVLSTNVEKNFPESYLRYLTNDLRESFGFHGMPIRVFPRKGKNPYDKK